LVVCAAFSKDGEYAEWVLEQPAVIKINNVVFLHGGLTPDSAALGISEINSAIQQALASFLKSVEVLERRVIGPAGFRDLLSVANQAVSRSGRNIPKFQVQAAQRMLDELDTIGFAPHGPLWYRGNALENERIERERFDAVLEHLDAKALMVGTRVGDRPGLDPELRSGCRPHDARA
jgi:hypothetical protein